MNKVYGGTVNPLKRKVGAYVLTNKLRNTAIITMRVASQWKNLPTTTWEKNSEKVGYMKTMNGLLGIRLESPIGEEALAGASPTLILTSDTSNQLTNAGITAEASLETSYTLSTSGLKKKCKDMENVIVNTTASAWKM